MSWEQNEFQEMLTKVVLLLERENFYQKNEVDDRFKFIEILEDKLYESNDNSRLSSILLDCLEEYRAWEIGVIIDSLSQKELIQMVITEDGRLSYQPTIEGVEISEIIKKMLDNDSSDSDNKFF
jgi:hypothetical protein